MRYPPPMHVPHAGVTRRPMHAPDAGATRPPAAAGNRCPRRYLVTGGAGFIGSHLVDRLVARGAEVTVLDDFSGGAYRNLRDALSSGRVRVVEGSVADAGVVERLMAEVDACFHLAAALGVKRIVDQPLESLLENVRGTDTVLAAAQRHGCRLLFASSSEVYGKRDGADLNEHDDCTIGATSRSRWSYAIAKQFGEALAHAYVKDAAADMAAVRFFNIVGARQNPAYGMVLPRFIDQALHGQPLSVYGDGSQSRCFTSVHDAINALDALIDTPGTAGSTYNVGVSDAVRVDDLARLVLDATQSDSQVVYVPYGEAYGPGYEELGRRVPDTTALRLATGWAPRQTITDTIAEVVDARRGLLASSLAASATTVIAA